MTVLITGASSGIGVSLVCPGGVGTDFFKVAQRRTHHHQGLGVKADTAEAVAFWIVDLAHPEDQHF